MTDPREYYTDRQDRSDIDDEHFEADLLAVELAEIRKRADWLGRYSDDSEVRESAADVPRLLAALDAALALAGEWQAKSAELWEQITAKDLEGASAGFKGIGASVNREHAKALQEAISRALLAKDGG